MNKDTLGIKYHCLTLSCFSSHLLGNSESRLSLCRVEIYCNTLPPAMVSGVRRPMGAASDCLGQGRPSPGHPMPAPKGHFFPQWYSDGVDSGLH